MRDFASWMAGQRAGQASWFEAFHLQHFESGRTDPEIPVFIDVGGGVGHQCLALRARFPALKMRIILQDLPSVLHQATPTEGVEHMPHSFWEEQPVEGMHLMAQDLLLLC